MIIALTRKNQLKLASTWLFRLPIVLAMIFLPYKYLDFSIIECFLSLLILTIFFIVPPVITHIWYSRQSRRYVIILKDSTVLCKKDGMTNNYNYCNIKLVLYNKLATYDTGPYASGLEPFRNLQIFTNDGEVYFITCLMYYKVEDLIDFFEKREVKVVVNNGSIGFKNKMPANS
jgi:hypothetical protein